MAMKTPTLESSEDKLQQAKKIWTVEDYFALPDDGKRYEIIDGDIFEMPSPAGIHQLISGKLAYFLTAWVLAKQLGLILAAPMDVVLENATSVVQPDLIFISDDQKHIFNMAGAITGSPRVLVEILSPSTKLHDQRTKLSAYEQAGVKEYWIINPTTSSLEIYFLEGEAYALAGEYIGDDKPESPVLGKLEFELSELFKI